MAKRTDSQIIERAIQMYAEGMTVPLVAKQLPISESVLYRALSAKGIKPRELMRRGIRGKANRKFTDEQEERIASIYHSGKSLATLANEWNVNLVTIRNALIRQGVARRRQGDVFRSFTQDQIADMAGRWSMGESQTAIAVRYGTHQTVVGRLLSAHGFKKEHRRAKRERHGNWQGGRAVRPQGYISILVEADSPFASMRNCMGYIMEHRLIMAQHLNRPLADHETVHHINGDITDNRLENLQLRNSGHGKGKMLKCLDCGSTNIVTISLV